MSPPAGTEDGLGSTADVRGNVNPPPKKVPTEARPAALAAVGDMKARPKPILTGNAKLWRILPMNERGQPVADASIVAVHSVTGEERKGAGKVDWAGIAAGHWDVTIEAEGMPIWKRTVELAQDERQVTPARLGKPCAWPAR